MENNRQLADVFAGTEWHEAVSEMRTWGWEIEEQIAHYGEILIQRVLVGACSLDELRGGVVWANALDAESVQRGIDIKATNEDGTEALRRRLVHHAGRMALNTLKSANRRNKAITQRDNRKYRQIDIDLSYFRD